MVSQWMSRLALKFARSGVGGALNHGLTTMPLSVSASTIIGKTWMEPVIRVVLSNGDPITAYTDISTRSPRAVQCFLLILAHRDVYSLSHQYSNEFRSNGQ